ncbi:unnamed protein product [Linum trigynum]
MWQLFFSMEADIGKLLAMLAMFDPDEEGLAKEATSDLLPLEISTAAPTAPSVPLPPTQAASSIDEQEAPCVVVAIATVSSPTTAEGSTKIPAIENFVTTSSKKGDLAADASLTLALPIIKVLKLAPPPLSENPLPRNLRGGSSGRRSRTRNLEGKSELKEHPHLIGRDPENRVVEKMIDTCRGTPQGRPTK